MTTNIIIGFEVTTWWYIRRNKRVINRNFIHHQPQDDCTILATFSIKYWPTNICAVSIIFLNKITCCRCEKEKKDDEKKNESLHFRSCAAVQITTPASVCSERTSLRAQRGERGGGKGGHLKLFFLHIYN